MPKEFPYLGWPSPRKKEIECQQKKDHSGKIMISKYNLDRGMSSKNYSLKQRLLRKNTRRDLENFIIASTISTAGLSKARENTK